MKRAHTVAAGVIVVAGLAAVFVFLQLPAPDNEMPAGRYVADEQLRITHLRITDIDAIRIFYEDEEIFLRRDGSDITIVDDLVFGMNIQAMRRIFETFARVQADRIIDEEPKHIAQYGLDFPKVHVEGMLSDGRTMGFTIGSLLPTGDGYYLAKKPEGPVYSVSRAIAEAFMVTMHDLEDRTLAVISNETFKSLMIDAKDRRPVEIALMTQQQQAEHPEIFSPYWMVQPYQHPMGVDADAFFSLLRDMPAQLRINEFIGEPKLKLEDYGLSSPQYEVLIDDGRNLLHLLIGHEAVDGTVYAMLPESEEIVTLSSRDLQFLEYQAYTLVDPYVYIIGIDYVSSLTITSETFSYTGKIFRDIDGESYKINDTVIDERPFKAFYQAVIGLMTDAELAGDMLFADPILEIAFEMLPSQHPVHIEFFPYDSDFFAVGRAGAPEFLISRIQTNRMLERIEYVYLNNQRPPGW